MFIILQEAARTIEFVVDEFKGPAGEDIDGIPLFKSERAIEERKHMALKHLSCMQVSLPQELLWTRINPNQYYMINIK